MFQIVLIYFSFAPIEKLLKEPGYPYTLSPIIKPRA